MVNRKLNVYLCRTRSSKAPNGNWNSTKKEERWLEEKYPTSFNEETSHVHTSSCLIQKPQMIHVKNHCFFGQNVHVMNHYCLFLQRLSE